MRARLCVLNTASRGAVWSYCLLAFACGGAAPRVATPVAGSPVLVAPDFLLQYGATYGFSHGRPKNIQVSPTGDTVFFLRSPARSFRQDLYAVDVATGRESLVASAAQLLEGSDEHLSPAEKARRERQRLVARGIASYSLSHDGTKLLIPLSGRLFVVERASGKVIELASDRGYPIDARFSPDGTMVSCVRDRDLYITDLATGQERRLTTAPAPGVSNGEADFVAQEELQRIEGYWWSPDSRWLAYQQTDNRVVEQIYFSDPMHPERPPRTARFPRAGTANPRVRVGVIAVQGGPTTWLPWDRERYPYLARVVWSRDAPLTLLVQNRAQTETRLLAAASAAGETRELVKETDAAWVNIDFSVPRWLPDGSGFLWSSERSGHWQLELRAADGSLIAPLTSAEHGYEALLGYDPSRRVAYIAGVAKDTSRHLWEVPLEGAPRRMSQERGVHGAVFARDGGVRVHTFAGPDASPSWVIESREGRALARLRSMAEEPDIQLNAEWTVAGPARIPALVLRPRDFVKGRRYPVVLSFYGGNYATAERRTTALFLATSLANWVVPVRRAYLLDQWLADQGFIVVNIDGRGTPGRGRDWERAIDGADFGAVQIADQVAGLKDLGQRYPEFDMDRVGVYGWSLGGYLAALAVLLRPDVFHAAIAGAPVSEWRDYDTHYSERYFGLPDRQPASYDKNSLIGHARNLRRPLLLVHGTGDDNVYLMHSIKLSQALFRAGKRHEFLALAGVSHMVPDPVVTRRLQERIVAFFRAYLVEQHPVALPASLAPGRGAK